ncbi:hypothetical protein OsI_23230 [Oryza sativa Indica Group]|uniref:Uncharacterized protein n=1 Tax=Oryza sativa subsp. indica TaxID=39946 RepID=B8B3B0_ORYSI|nr:hypothetical protein OsI_23230 [Oryza sativa Indica Group]
MHGAIGQAMKREDLFVKLDVTNTIEHGLDDIVDHLPPVRGNDRDGDIVYPSRVLCPSLPQATLSPFNATAAMGLGTCREIAPVNGHTLLKKMKTTLAPSDVEEDDLDSAQDENEG